MSEDARITAMQIDRRFADYALTGGFFLICNFGMLWALGYGPKNIPKELKDLLQSDTPLPAPIITGFAAALAVIAVFVVGLILDLLASIFRMIETKEFATHLDYNSGWINVLVEAHKAYCGKDYETFQRAQRELQSLMRQGPGDAYVLETREQTPLCNECEALLELERI